jgi:hypothetical protein
MAKLIYILIFHINFYKYFLKQADYQLVRFFCICLSSANNSPQRIKLQAISRRSLQFV